MRKSFIIFIEKNRFIKVQRTCVCLMKFEKKFDIEIGVHIFLYLPNKNMCNFLLI